MVRIQVLLTPEEKAGFRRMAEREGLSLSAWLRQAGLDRLEAARRIGRFRNREDLAAFFVACDTHHGAGREPDWAEHLETMRRSRRDGESGT